MVSVRVLTTFSLKETETSSLHLHFLFSSICVCAREATKQEEVDRHVNPRWLPACLCALNPCAAFAFVLSEITDWERLARSFQRSFRTASTDVSNSARSPSAGLDRAFAGLDRASGSLRSVSGRRGQRRLDVRVFTHPRGWRVESIGAEEEETMPRADRLPVPVPVLVLVLTMTTFVQRGGALRCYRCSDYTGRCDDVHECAYEDACLTLGVQGGKTVRQCIRYTDCDNSRLSQMFPSMSSFSYRCCNNNLCNSSGAVGVATPGPLLLIGWLLSALAPWL
ncbi:CD59 glycoprotein isoform X1 [Phycodurus eques]|uniref:CD59 glycoprotein isoform X1 n=1 Tax=Phycodurus eques TaxID=693459 RepID=UPI002ACEB73C|nr:CD59 glycoprotein isoform X1 [Phycodurus eques]